MEPVDPAFAVTVWAWYLDPDPDTYDPRKGYWIAYANYTDECWEISGPYLSYEARVFFKEGVDLVGGSGFINVMVFCENGNRVNIDQIQIGSNAGFGYEETLLGATHGSFIGDQLELCVDGNDNPHILYTTAPSMLHRADLHNNCYVAHHDGTEWSKVGIDISTINEIRWGRLAAGSGGRRAVLISDDASTDQLVLYYDDGGGTFTEVGQVAASMVTQCISGMTFISSTDDPLGDRDLLLMTYAKYTATPITQTFYRTYDGVALGAETPMYGLTTRHCGRLSLCTTPSNLGMAGVPSEAGGDWRYYVGTYSAVADLWDFGTITSWVIPENAEWDSSYLDYRPDFLVRCADNGDIIAGYLTEDEANLRVGSWDGANWLSEPADRVPYAPSLMETVVNLAAFSTGTAATLMPFGSMSPMLTFGKPGVGDEWFRSYINLDAFSMIQGSMAIDGGNNVHMACISFFEGGLQYYRRDAVTHDITTELVDLGNEEPGMSSGFCRNVPVDDAIHLFYIDEGNYRICRSVNRGGVWEVEHENIVGDFTGAPYMIDGAGYLPDDDLLWVVFLDYFTMSTYCASGPPDGSDWQVHPFAGMTMYPASAVDNDEEIGLVVPAMVMGEGKPAFIHGGPRDGPHTPELVTLNADYIAFPFYLYFNGFNGQWMLVSTSADHEQVNYFLRAPAGGWIGPYVVEDVSDTSGETVAGGISVNHDDGTVRINLKKTEGGSTDDEIWIYSAPNGSAVFTPTSQMMVIDNSVDNFMFSICTPTANGEPLVGVCFTPGGDPTMDVRFFKETTPDTWTSLGVWSTSVMAMYPDLGVTPGGGIVCSGIEMADPVNMGRVVLYYPWE